VDAGGRGVVVVDGGAWGVHVEVLAVWLPLCQERRDWLIGSISDEHPWASSDIHGLVRTTDHVISLVFFSSHPPFFLIAITCSV